MFALRSFYSVAISGQTLSFETVDLSLVNIIDTATSKKHLCYITEAFVEYKAKNILFFEDSRKYRVVKQQPWSRIRTDLNKTKNLVSSCSAMRLILAIATSQGV